MRPLYLCVHLEIGIVSLLSFGCVNPEHFAPDPSVPAISPLSLPVIMLFACPAPAPHVRYDTSRGRTLNPFHASPTSPQPYQADKFVDAGFLMHWGEDMKSVPGSGGSSCTSPAPLNLQPISGLKRARFARHAGCWFCRFSQEQLADSTRELGQVPEHGVSHS